MEKNFKKKTPKKRGRPEKNSDNGNKQTKKASKRKPSGKKD